MSETHLDRSFHLVARLLLMIGMICAVLAQLIGLRAQLALQNDQLSNIKDMQIRLYKQTVVGLASQKVETALDESMPWPAKDDEPGNDLGSDHSGKHHTSAENGKTIDSPIDTPEVKALDEQRMLDIQRVINKKSHVPLTEEGQIDWNQIDHVFYYHTRKAG
jgi:hypothetical protein